MKDSAQKDFWNIVFSILFVFFVYLLVWVLYVVHGALPTSINIFDLVLVILASFRLVRLFVYDKITKFLHNFFLHTKDGKERTSGPLYTLYELITCPWCFGVWVSATVTFFYFLTPLAWLPILILAVSSVASFLQLLSNMIGWAAENGKIQAQKNSL